MKNLELYEKVRKVPQEAQKTIKGGRLNGYTDINPMWRMKTLTEHFGPCGVGWYYKIIDRWTEAGADGVVACFVSIELYIKIDGEWSMPIVGTGGSSLVSKEKGGLYTNDECFKMALTDAISVSCKSLGFGADIYWDKDRTKYAAPQHDFQNTMEKVPTATPEQAKRIQELLFEIGKPLEALLKKQNVKKLEELTEVSAASIIKSLENLVKKDGAA